MNTSAGCPPAARPVSSTTSYCLTAGAAPPPDETVRRCVGTPVRQPGRTRPPVGFRPSCRRQCSPMVVHGCMTRRFLFEYPTRCGSSGCTSSLGGFRRSVDMPATELRDRWAPVDAVWRRSWDRIRNQSATSHRPPRHCGFGAGAAIATCRGTVGGLDLVRHTGGRLETSHGAVPVGALTDAAGVSGNHLPRSSSLMSGHPEAGGADLPLCAADPVRRPLRPVETGRSSLNGGLLDRAHSAGEFKDFTGHTRRNTGPAAPIPAEQGFRRTAVRCR